MESSELAALPWDVTALAVLLVANRAAAKSMQNPAVFWVLQALLLGGALWFGFNGIRGLEGHPVARWIVTALLCFHAVQNYMARQGNARKL